MARTKTPNYGEESQFAERRENSEANDRIPRRASLDYREVKVFTPERC